MCKCQQDNTDAKHCSQKLLTYKLYKYNVDDVSKSINNHITLAGTATVGPKGQVVIPYEVRREMSIEPGDKLVVLYIPDKKSVGFIPETRLQEIINKMGSQLDSLKSIVSDK